MMTETMIADIQRARDGLTAKGSYLTRLGVTVHHCEESFSVLDDMLNLYGRSMFACAPDASLAKDAVVRLHSSACLMSDVDDVEFVLLCQAVVREHVEAQKHLANAKNGLSHVRGDIENQEILRAFDNTLGILSTITIDPLIQKIALESDSDLKYTKHQHHIEFLPGSRISVDLMYDGVHLGSGVFAWVCNMTAKEIIDSIIEYWPVVVWKNFASAQRELNEKSFVTHKPSANIIVPSDIRRLLMVIDNT